MKLAHGILGLTAACAMLVSTGYAQEMPKSDKPEMAKTAVRGPLMPIQTFFLTNATLPNDGNELLTAIRLLLPPGVKIYYTPGQNSISLSGAPEEIALGKKLIEELDRPKKSYRLNFTLTESEGGKKIGVQRTGMVVVGGQRTTLKNGSKVPVATGSYSNTGPSVQTQFTYLDVGINIDVTLNEMAGGGQLKCKVEQSSIGEEKTMGGVQEPIVRQSVMEGVSLLQMGKPEVIGSLDITGSTRHLDIEVVMEPIK